MKKKEQQPPTDFGKAGIRYESVCNGKITHKLQMPWGYVFKTEPSAFSLIASITDKFAVIESTTMDGTHNARIIDKKNHEVLDITITSKYMRVYPTTNTHQESSERIYEILKYYSGHLDTDKPRVICPKAKECRPVGYCSHQFPHYKRDSTDKDDCLGNCDREHKCGGMTKCIDYEVTE